jgi:hypothetical protein
MAIRLDWDAAVEGLTATCRAVASGLDAEASGAVRRLAAAMEAAAAALRAYERGFPPGGASIQEHARASLSKVAGIADGRGEPA